MIGRCQIFTMLMPSDICLRLRNQRIRLIVNLLEWIQPLTQMPLHEYALV